MLKLKKFEHAELIRDWELLLKLSREEIIDIEASWEEVMVFNKDVFNSLIEERNTKISEICAHFKNLGIEVYKYKKKGFFSEKAGYLKWFDTNVIKEIMKKYPSTLPEKPRVDTRVQEIEGIKLSNNSYNISLLKLYDTLQFQYKNGKSKKQSENKLLIESVKYATKHNIDIENVSDSEIIAIVREHAVNAYEKETFTDGEELYLKHGCDNCSAYIAGEHRCSCGNRRVYIEVEGDILSGFYYFLECY